MDNKLRHQIYLDIFQPSAQRIGMSLFCVTDGLASRFEKWCYRLDKEILLENQISPPAHILVPILEGMVYHEDNTSIQEMFYNLLVNSMDKTKQDLCHPAFPKILSQLSIDEIIIIYLVTHKKTYLINTESLVGPLLFYHDSSIPIEKISPIIEHLEILGIFSTDYGYIMSNSLHVTGAKAERFLATSEFGKQFFKACINEKTEELILEIIKNNPK